MQKKAITRKKLGAWVIRCNPDTFDIVSYVEAGFASIDKWNVADNDLAAMMRPGDDILFWVTGSDPVYKRGFWGSGQVTERPRPLKPRRKHKDLAFWTDDKVRTPADLYVYCDMPLLIPGGMLSDKQLRTDGVNELEVQLQPNGDNPSWVSKDQMDRIMHVFMGLIADRQDDWSVQEAALLTVTESYETKGWTVADMTDEEMGYNLYCTFKDQQAVVLVKGTHHAGAVVLYEEELKVAKAHPDSWRLALVRDALTDPQIEMKTAAEVIAEAKPYAYALTL